MAAESEHTTDATRWLLKYGDRVYGPYSFDAMTGYIAEGRVIASSIIAPEGTTAESLNWWPASKVDVFAESFGIPKEQYRVAPNYRAPAEQIEDVKEIEETPVVVAETTEAKRPAYGPSKGQIDRRRQPETANFIVIMDIKARYAGQLEQAIMSLGPAYKLAPNVWCVNADSTTAGLLNDLSIHIGKTDSMFIVDATRDRTAWHNLGPETDAKLRRVWRRAF
ncbi:MAG: hypothetical protein V4441_07850 [Pseudomonadota bacterium]